MTKVKSIRCHVGVQLKGVVATGITVHEVPKNPNARTNCDQMEVIESGVLVSYGPFKKIVPFANVTEIELMPEEEAPKKK